MSSRDLQEATEFSLKDKVDSCVSAVFPMYPLRNDFFHWRSVQGNEHVLLGIVCMKYL